MKFGLKVHHSDLSELLYMKPEALEFALFPGDMGGAWADKVRFDGPIAVHMPEKFSDGSLIDLASPYAGKRTKAVRILKKTIDIAERLNASIVICHPGGVRKKAEDVDVGPLLGSVEELKAYAPAGVELVLENMPDIYWYNGALYTACLFKWAEDITDALKKLDIGLCMDLSHAKLYCNSSYTDFMAYVESLRPFIRHLHVADARGVTSEGLQVSEGEIDFKALLPILKGLDVITVPEIRGGHDNGGAGFKLAADRLAKLGYFDGKGRL